jgi:hypothetical protein
MCLNRHLACDLIVIIRYELNEMADYKPDLSSQNNFIPIDFSQQIMHRCFEYTLAHIVDNRLDLSGFDKSYYNDKKGTAVYSPSVMLKILLFGYSRRFIRSTSKNIPKSAHHFQLNTKPTTLYTKITHYLT